MFAESGYPGQVSIIGNNTDTRWNSKPKPSPHDGDDTHNVCIVTDTSGDKPMTTSYLFFDKNGKAHEMHVTENKELVCRNKEGVVKVRHGTWTPFFSEYAIADGNKTVLDNYDTVTIDVISLGAEGNVLHPFGNTQSFIQLPDVVTFEYKDDAESTGELKGVVSEDVHGNTIIIVEDMDNLPHPVHMHTNINLIKA